MCRCIHTYLHIYTHINIQICARRFLYIYIYTRIEIMAAVQPAAEHVERTVKSPYLKGA